jgi:hypothetical protein
VQIVASRPRVLVCRNNCVTAPSSSEEKRMTVLDISPISSAHPASPMTDTVSTADDAQRLHLMEEMLRDRGYSRNQHGFLVAPGSRMTAAKVESE